MLTTSAPRQHDDPQQPTTDSPGPAEANARPIASTPAWRSWYLALVPLLAILAYINVRNIGFLSDDIGLLTQARSGYFNWGTLLPSPEDSFYRPFTKLLIWVLGWHLFGFNALPFHLIGLLVHAGAALMLSLWMLEATQRRWLSWLAGALFAVFPAHTEAVGWLAAQWDAWAVFFGISSLWMFTYWWRRAGQARLQYWLAVLLFGLGLWTKESMLIFLPIYVLTTWMLPRLQEQGALRRLALSLLPFGALLGVNLTLRLIFTGRLGGYATASTDYTSFVWDNLIIALRALVAPINQAALGPRVAQLVGLTTTVLLLFGLIWFGGRYRKLLITTGAWTLLGLAPTLNLGIGLADLQGNRFLYIAAAGYCALVATLIYALVVMAGRWRPPALGLVALLIVASIATTWLHLRPWELVTAEVNRVEQYLLRLMPPRPGSVVTDWYVENVPDSYQGAYSFRLGLGHQRYYLTEYLAPVVMLVPQAAAADLNTQLSDSFAMRFVPPQEPLHIDLDYLVGVTGAMDPPAAPEPGSSSKQVWDFTTCADLLASWSANNASVSCEAGRGLTVQARNNDPQLQGPEISLPIGADQARFIRLRVSMSDPGPSETPQIMQLFWMKPGDSGWLPEQSQSMIIKQKGVDMVYWIFVPTSSLPDGAYRLRLDPISDAKDVTVQWIAADLVK